MPKVVHAPIEVKTWIRLFEVLNLIRIQRASWFCHTTTTELFGNIVCLQHHLPTRPRHTSRQYIVSSLESSNHSTTFYSHFICKMNPPTMASSLSHRSRSRIPVIVNRQGYPRKPIRVKRYAAPKNSSLAYRPRSNIPIPIIHPGIPRKPIRVKRYLASIRVTNSAPKESGQVPEDQKKAYKDEAGRLPDIDTSTGTQEIFSCAICLGPITRSCEPLTTQCGHVFCMECLITALVERRNCPTCQSMTHIDLCIQLYFS